MSLLQSITLGIIQGITEFLPISSSGHLIIAREFFGLTLENTLSFDVLLHLSTLLAIIIYFWKDITAILLSIKSDGFLPKKYSLAWAIIVGTIPAGLVGFLFGDILEDYFRNPVYVAIALILGSVVFFVADLISKRVENIQQTKDSISIKKGFIIGVFQSFALIPGVSRSGITISGGLLFGVSRIESIRFAFLLAIPAISGAALKTLLGIASDPTLDLMTSLLSINYILGFIAAFISGLLAVRFLVRYLSSHSFTPFIIYRLILAGIILLF